MKQLTKLACYFNVPFGYFFLKDLPVIKYPVPHYRSGSTEPFNPSDELLETIRTIEERQYWARDLRKELNGELPFAGSVTLQTDIKTGAQKIQDLLGLTIAWNNHEAISSWDDAFRFLIRRTEEAGIFVTVNGVVNNNTHRKLKVDEFPGFVLHDSYAPFVFINNNDFVTGKIFTLVHEIAHILIGHSASFENKELLPASAETEKFCDALAAEFLVPEALLLQKTQQNGADYDQLARSFSDSRLTIARRLFDIKKIRKTEFDNAYKKYKTGRSEKVIAASNGGNFYNTSTYRIGRSFFNLIYSSVKQHRILYRDAFKLTSLTPKAFDGYINKHLK